LTTLSCPNHSSTPVEPQLASSNNHLLAHTKFVCARIFYLSRHQTERNHFTVRLWSPQLHLITLDEVWRTAVNVHQHPRNN
jgi:hypothetical protein